MAKKFLIAPFKTGMQTDVRPWIIPNDAFEQLDNAYIYHDRVRKKYGSQLLNQAVTQNLQHLRSRLAINLGPTVAGALAGAVPGAAVGSNGQMFAINDDIYTAWQVGGAPAPMLKSTGAVATTFTYDNAGNYNFAGVNPDGDVYFYPALPVMGLCTRELDAINEEQLIAFDTQFAYEYSNTTNRFERITGGSDLWTGSNSDFFSYCNYRGIEEYQTYFFVTNYTVADRIRYYDGTNFTVLPTQYTATAADIVQTARIVIPFQNRLLLLNTIESYDPGSGRANFSYTNRVRYSTTGDPTTTNSFNTGTAGVGEAGFYDLPVKQAIIGAQILRNRLIIFAEESTWELVYLGNRRDPFRFQQINNELGVESTFSTVLFDKVLLGIGNVGIHACNGASVERIDEKIEETVFEIQNDNDGLKRVHGIRDYDVQMVYWTYPDKTDNPTYPNKVLVYNYRTGAWAFNDDSFTTFGYWQPETDITWATWSGAWQTLDYDWNNAGLQSHFRKIVAGNQEGFVVQLEPGVSRNAPYYQVTNIDLSAPYTNASPGITVIDHNLISGEYVYFDGLTDFPDMNGEIFEITKVDKDTFTIIRDEATLRTYNGGATITLVPNYDILTKQFNFFQQEGKNAYIPKISCLVDATTAGEITLDAFPSFSDISMVDEGTATGALIGDGILETHPYPAALAPLEQTQDMLWHDVYPQTSGENIQFNFYLSDDQITDPDIAFSDFQLHAMLIYAEPIGRLE